MEGLLYRGYYKEYYIMGLGFRGSFMGYCKECHEGLGRVIAGVSGLAWLE